MAETQTEPMDVPEGWTRLETTPFQDPDAVAYQHDERSLRGQVYKSEGMCQSSITDIDEGLYKVYPEEFDDRDDAIERLRMHMGYYS